MIQLYEFTVLRFYRLFLLTLQYIDTLRLYAFTILRLYRLLLFTLSAKKHKFTNLRFYAFTENFAHLPNWPFYAPKAARSDRKFTNLPFYGAFLGNNGIYHCTVLPFYGQRRALDPRLTQRHHSMFLGVRKDQSWKGNTYEKHNFGWLGLTC